MKYLSFYLVFLGMYIVSFAGCTFTWKEASWKVFLGSLWDSLGYAFGMFGLFSMLIIVFATFMDAFGK